MEPGPSPKSDHQSPDLENQPTDSDLHEVRVIAENSARYFGARVHEIDEVVQRTLIKVWEHWSSPHIVRARHRRGVRWAAYIRKIAKHQHLDLVRGHGRRLERDTLAAGLRRTGAPRPGVHRVRDDQAVNEMEAIVGRQHIIELFEQLPERQRMVAHLVLVEELSPAEIGERFDWDPQAVRKSLRAAKEKLKVLIHEQLEEHYSASDSDPDDRDREQT